MDDINPIKEKVTIIAKDIDMQFQFFNRSAMQLSTLQGWTLTVVLAYLAFLASIRAHSALTLLPLGFVILLFMFLEVRLRRDLFSACSEMRDIERVFMESNPVKFTEDVKKYVFRDMTAETKQWPNPFKYLKNPRVITWYVSLFLLACTGYLGIIRLSNTASPCR
jgi:hypothetical protein